MTEAASSSELTGFVRQLVATVATTLSKKPLEEDVLVNLESSDENFQSYRLVKYIREQIEAELGSVLDKKVEPLVGTMQEQQLARISDEIMATEEYNRLCFNIPAIIKRTVEELLQDSAWQPSIGGESYSNASSSLVYYNLEKSIGSDWSSLQDSQGVMFVPQQKFDEIAMKLASTKESCLEALSELRRCPLGDLPQCAEWRPIKEGISKCLADEDRQIVDSALHVLSLMFANVCATTACEVHEILISNLSSCFQDSRKELPKEELDLLVGTNLNILYKCRFLNHIHLQVSSHWIRYNERLLEDIVCDYFSILDLDCSFGFKGITFVHYLALIDPLASWFHNWMHAEFSRAKVLDYLACKSNLIKKQLLHVIEYSKTTRRLPSSLSKAKVYSMADLNYLVYVHNVRVITKLLCYERGQRVIDKALSSLDDGIKCVCISDLLLHLVEQAFHFPAAAVQSDDVVWSPPKLVSRLLDSLASGNQRCRQLLCDERLVDTIISCLGEEQINRVMLEQSIDVLSVLAASVDGQKFFLNQPSTMRIAQYVSSALNKTPPHLSPLLHVCLFFCRQLYSTAEGLLALLPYDLHSAIAHFLSGVQGNEWRRFLISNLLNFASTPKGVVILGQTKLLSECVQYMHERYQLKLQVSHCEKFGYGFMVTQVASTACGMRCLIQGEYVGNLIQLLWSTLQEEDMDEPLALSTHPLDPSNRILHKAIVNVLNVISSYTSLYEAVITTESSDVGSAPETLSGFLQLLLFSESFHKVMNPLECHLCALRILSVLITSLDSYLLLELHFNVSKRLNQLQDEVRLPNGGYIIDPCSIERNRIIVATTFIGGPNERILPPHYLSDVKDDYGYPLFSNTDPPAVFLKTPCHLKEHLKETDISNCSSLSDLQGLFIQKTKAQGYFSSFSVCCFLEKGLEYQKKELQPVKLITRPALSQYETSGIQLVVSYGLRLGLLKESTAKELPSLFLHTGSDIEKGFDWLLATMYLIFAPAFEKDCFQKTLRSLEAFSCSLISIYTWKYHPSATKDILCSVSLHHVELILQAELPLVYSAFKISGCSPSQVCQDMIKQCFFNYLDWSEICLYILLLILLGADYQVYFCVAILSHLQAKILKACQDHNLLILLKEGMISDFHLSEQIDYLMFLAGKYHTSILKDMKAQSSCRYS